MSFSNRLLIGIWLLACFILSSSYAGNLKGFLTNLGNEPKIETPEQVLESGLPYYWHDHGTKIFFEHTQNKAVQMLDKTSLSFPGPLSVNMMTQMVMF